MSSLDPSTKTVTRPLPQSSRPVPSPITACSWRESSDSASPLSPVKIRLISFREIGSPSSRSRGPSSSGVSSPASLPPMLSFVTRKRGWKDGWTDEPSANSGTVVPSLSYVIWSVLTMNERAEEDNP